MDWMPIPALFNCFLAMAYAKLSRAKRLKLWTRMMSNGRGVDFASLSISTNIGRLSSVPEAPGSM